VVHLAWQQSLNREVALKRLMRALSGNHDATARLRREGQVIARLDDPRIIRLYDLITEGADLVLVMEYVRGPSVQSLAAAAPPSASQALAVIGDVAGALDHAARHGVVHRDVKPANVLVTAAGRCKLGDFGLARLASERTMFMSNDGRIRGTPLYMAPEQLRGEEPGPGSDVYALAVMALELLSGHHPFTGLSVREAAKAHLDGGAAAAAANSHLPRRVSRVLEDGLVPAAGNRPTAHQLADGLIQAAPRSWLASDTEARIARPTATAAPAHGTRSGEVSGSGGLWARANDDGWTKALVGPATWLETSDLTADELTWADPEAKPNRSSWGGRPDPPLRFHAAERMATIDDGWIRQSRLGKAARPVSRVRQNWAAILAAFVIGFVLVLTVLELLRH
jgi:serine/threonine protein kinase